MAGPDRRDLWLAGPVLLAMAPHALYVPAWVGLAALAALAWRLSPPWRRHAPAQRAARLVLAVAALAGTWLQFGTLLGPEAGISLLAIMVALKLLESEGRRDHMVVVLAGYFLLMTVLIHHQGIAATAWLLLAATALTAALVANQASRPPDTLACLRLGAALVVQALPLALLLFLLFPRLPSPMAGLVEAGAGRTGLADQMAPGSVSRLIRSAAVAFRVDFADPAVDARGLYWRGPVLPVFDGRTWQRGGATSLPPSADRLADRLDYHITLEPGEAPWLPVAGLATGLPLPHARVSRDLEWQDSRPRHDRLRYAVAAWQRYRLEPDLSAWRRAQALALPEGGNPDTVALARRWAAAAGSPAAVVEQALHYFRTEPFHYTLRPPPLGEHSVDAFLFQTRRGFCEHYAGAFTVLMRAAGVPARVVTGYQGGERNPVGGYWIVRSRDAHAWAEVWLDGRGWLRVDPTAAVAPERVELGLDAALPAAERPLLDAPPAWLQPLGQAWDYLDNGWNQWVLGYDFERQRRLLSTLSPSLASLEGMLWAMLAGAALVLAGLALGLLRGPARVRPDPAERLYRRFLARLARAGLSKGAAEGPADFAARAARDRPDLAAAIQAVSRLYIGLRYGGGGDAGALRRALRGFRPGLVAGKKPPGRR